MAGPRRLRVYLDGDPVGTVEQTAQGSLSFVYDDAHRSAPEATPLSLSMPLTGSRHSNKVVRAYLDGLLPDSQAARQRWAQQHGVSANNPFSLLGAVGRDAAGAVQVLPDDTDPEDARARTGDIEWLSTEDLASVAAELAEHGGDWNPGRFGGRWSLAGAQPKIALFQDPSTGRFGVPRDSTPTTCIIKPAIEGFAGHHINEALCLRAAEQAGVRAAAVDLVEIAGVRAVVSHRYDRHLDDTGTWHRIHQEDMCQALSVPPDQKYQSQGGPGVGAIGGLLRTLPAADRAASAEQFFKALVFNVLIAGTDAHAKNYSMVLIGSRARLAPIYDVASAAPYPQHERLSSAMRIGKTWKFLDVTSADWHRVAQQLDIRSEQASVWAEEIREELPDAFDRAVATLPADVQDEAGRMAQRIAAHADGTWRPDLDRDPLYVLPPGSLGPVSGQRTSAPASGMTTPGSNRGSYAPRRSEPADVDLEGP